jgi:hypothetical protein
MLNVVAPDEHELALMVDRSRFDHAKPPIPRSQKTVRTGTPAEKSSERPDQKGADGDHEQNCRDGKYEGVEVEGVEIGHRRGFLRAAN